MREQGVAAVGVESEQRTCQRSPRFLRQLLGPTAMVLIDGLRNGGVVETGRLAAEHHTLYVDLQAGVRTCSGRRA